MRLSNLFCLAGLWLIGTGTLAGCSDAAVNAQLPSSTAPARDGDRDPATQHLPSKPLQATAPAGARDSVKLHLLGRFRHGGFNTSAAEICGYHAASRRLFVVNAEQSSIDVLSIADPVQPALVTRVLLAEFGGKPNSVAVHGDQIAAAVSASPLQSPGCVVFLDVEGNILQSLTVGPQPDMLTFTPDGRWLLTANEGEPADDYLHDPAGSLSLIDVRAGAGQLSQNQVITLGFTAFEDRTALDPRVRIYGPKASVSQNLEPEYIAVSPDSQKAWVSLQEANAFAIIDLNQPAITGLVGLGYKDHSLRENALDANDQDQKVQLQTWPLRGMYQPDAIRAWDHAGATYIISANEGDHRKYSAYSEETRVSQLALDPVAFPQAEQLVRPDQLGRLLVTNSQGDVDGDGDFEELYSLGGRSFSIWNASGELVFDSGSDFERILADRFPDSFNADQLSNQADDRSDNKGPEPEGVALAEINDRVIAFIGMERHSGIMIYDVTNPVHPDFVDYVLTRDFTQPPASVEAGDLGPEGLLVIPADQSPNGKPLLVVSFEVSGTTAIFEIHAGDSP